jgi:hypothetical protein
MGGGESERSSCERFIIGIYYFARSSAEYIVRIGSDEAFWEGVGGDGSTRGCFTA